MGELSPDADSLSQSFKWVMEPIKSRAAMRIAKQTFVWSHLPLELSGYPYMKLNVALAASIAALALMACAKKDAEVAAPAAEDAAAAAADSVADAAADAAAATSEAASDAADATADAAADAAAAATDAAAPADAAAAPQQ
jgi:hypothetical protein